MQNVFVSIQWFIDIQEYTLYKLAFWSLGLLHLKAGLAYFINPQKIDTYLSEGYSIGMTKDFGAHLWWLGCMLIALGFIEDITVQVFSCCLLCIGLLIPIIAEYQNIKAITVGFYVEKFFSKYGFKLDKEFGGLVKLI